MYQRGNLIFKGVFRQMTQAIQMPHSYKYFITVMSVVSLHLAHENATILNFSMIYPIFTISILIVFSMIICV
jgi:hypothetical protein